MNTSFAAFKAVVFIFGHKGNVKFWNYNMIGNKARQKWIFNRYYFVTVFKCMLPYPVHYYIGSAAVGVAYYDFFETSQPTVPLKVIIPFGVIPPKNLIHSLPAAVPCFAGIKRRQRRWANCAVLALSVQARAVL